MGELTEGIAHEIQKPVNFVNNFLMSSKLIDAMNEEIVKSNEQHRGSRNEILNESISTPALFRSGPFIDTWESNLGDH
ncbi:MAG: hypothetical protein IPI77_17725 [Saprospiraceae bacterium]|nr:hypothetical protein [Saprospiraceae bacterium]